MDEENDDSSKSNQESWANRNSSRSETIVVMVSLLREEMRKGRKGGHSTMKFTQALVIECIIIQRRQIQRQHNRPHSLTRDRRCFNTQ